MVSVLKAYPLVLRAGPLGSSKEFISVQAVLLGHGSKPSWHPEDAGLPPETEPLQQLELGTAWVKQRGPREEMQFCLQMFTG